MERVHFYPDDRSRDETRRSLAALSVSQRNPAVIWRRLSPLVEFYSVVGGTFNAIVVPMEHGSKHSNHLCFPSQAEIRTSS